MVAAFAYSCKIKFGSRSQFEVSEKTEEMKRSKSSGLLILTNQRAPVVGYDALFSG